jgi:predicted nucleotidyltransferase
MTRKIRNTGRSIDVSEHLPALERAFRQVPGLASVYLFGSYETTSQTPLSDIDIALVFRDGHEPSPGQHMELIGTVTEALREDDVSVTVLNKAPLSFRHKVLAEGRRLLLLDEVAHADFVESTITRYSDFAIDERRFFEEYDRALVEDYGSGSR